MKTQKEISKMSRKELEAEYNKLPLMFLTTAGREYRKRIVKQLVKLEKRK